MLARALVVVVVIVVIVVEVVGVMGFPHHCLLTSLSGWTAVGTLTRMFSCGGCPRRLPIAAGPCPREVSVDPLRDDGPWQVPLAASVLVEASMWRHPPRTPTMMMPLVASAVLVAMAVEKQQSPP